MYLLSMSSLVHAGDRPGHVQIRIGIDDVENPQRVVLGPQQLPLCVLNGAAQRHASEETSIETMGEFGGECIRHIGLRPDESSIAIIFKEEPREGCYRRWIDSRGTTGVEKNEGSLSLLCG